MCEGPRLERRAGLEGGHDRFFASQLTLAGRRRRGAQHLNQMIRTRPGGTVE